MKQIRYQAMLLWLLLGIVVLCKYGTTILRERSAVSGMEVSDLKGQAFREQKLNPKLLQQIQTAYPAPAQEGLADTIAATMLMGHFYPKKVYTEAPLLEKYKPKLWEEGRKAYQAIWGDLECFPIPEEEVFYENSWLLPRGNQGERQHEGCDLFGAADEPGRYPVVSITKGKVEQIGWLPLGGYRIGIRSPGGGYFYYAHLDSYGGHYQEGDEVQAGQVLGFMGNTGYGPEGTQGEFPTHLHLGIYIQAKGEPEMSVNPYWILQFLYIR